MKGYNTRLKYEKQQLHTELAVLNLRRWQPFGAAAIGIEVVLLVLLILSHTLDASFNFHLYSLMYLTMITVTGVMWFVSRHLLRGAVMDSRILKRGHYGLLLFLTFFMTWGAAISLFDQKIYGSITAYLINLTVGSYMFIIRSDRILIPQLISSLTLLIGLPFFQPSTDILIGHYVNIAIFLVFSWVMARTSYENFVNDFANRTKVQENARLLAKTNADLVSEIRSRERIQTELEAANEQLTAISALDALTGIPNRRKMGESLNQQWVAALTGRYPITLMMIDIDLFKLYNDTYGHLAGDNCLKRVAEVLSSTAGDNDLVARFGGEEFVYATTGIDRSEAYELGEKIRSDIEALHMEHAYSLISPYVTVSIGVKCLIPTYADMLMESLTQADKAMYEAKYTGRNRVIMAS